MAFSNGKALSAEQDPEAQVLAERLKQISAEKLNAQRAHVMSTSRRLPIPAPVRHAEACSACDKNATV